MSSGHSKGQIVLTKCKMDILFFTMTVSTIFQICVLLPMCTTLLFFNMWIWFPVYLFLWFFCDRHPTQANLKVIMRFCGSVGSWQTLCTTTAESALVQTVQMRLSLCTATSKSWDPLSIHQTSEQKKMSRRSGWVCGGDWGGLLHILPTFTYQVVKLSSVFFSIT